MFCSIEPPIDHAHGRDAEGSVDASADLEDAAVADASDASVALADAGVGTDKVYDDAGMLLCTWLSSQYISICATPEEIVKWGPSCDRIAYERNEEALEHEHHEGRHHRH